ncbi:MAG TPA: CaiB/BaiF CoA-transferase family protein [Mycobacteriales bacterium]|jgi:crotonobetainyl-CoA:carnitine CoA-transferase CaiB-like acyl-CoA transferase|nr:CaiB/BaiF CoA-transferase family protein [Mycobacteriales bacterium]
MSGLLDGIRVIESAMLFNGDRLGVLLGDLGADVVKVEAPPVGDYLRDFLGQIVPHHSPAHLEVNKHKRSVVINLRVEAGREVFWKLLATADVFVDGNAGDAMERLGVGYEQQRAHKPDIVYCQYSGYGSYGPYASIPTHGQMMNALAADTPYDMGPDGKMHASPRLGGMQGINGGEGTATGAIYAAYAVAAALLRRERTGAGAYIDVAASDAVVANSWIGATYSLNDARIADRSTMPVTGDQGDGAKYQFYETKDRKVILFCGIEPKFWKNFCAAVGRDDLVGAEATAPVDFAGGQAELRQELQRIFHTRDLADWVQVAIDHDIAMGPAYRTAAELPDDPHVAARGLFHPAQHPIAGPYTHVGFPARIAGSTYEVQRGAPTLGQHTDEVLTAAGVSTAELAALREARAIT